MNEPTSNHNENNITITNTVAAPNVVVNTPNSRGAGTVLLFVFFWPFLLIWWTLLLALWPVWLIAAAITTIFNHSFFVQTWYYPWPAWMFGIR